MMDATLRLIKTHLDMIQNKRQVATLKANAKAVMMTQMTNTTATRVNERKTAMTTHLIKRQTNPAHMGMATCPTMATHSMKMPVP